MSITLRAIGSMRFAGMTLPGNGCRVNGSYTVTGSSDRLPARARSVGTVDRRVTELRWRRKSKFANANVRLRHSGPPTLTPNWLRSNGGSSPSVSNALRAFRAWLRKYSYAESSNRLLPLRVMTFTWPAALRPYSAL